MTVVPQPPLAPRKPVRQHVRINLLRLLFVALIPPVLLCRPVWAEGSAMAQLLQTAGILLLFAAILGRFWAILYIGANKNGRVMDQGPYSICRHPLYFFSSLGALGFGLLLGSVLMSLAIGGLIAAVLYVTARREEAFLRSAFGADYAGYALRVPRLMPDPRLFSTPDRIEVSVRPLHRNLQDALVFLALLPFSELVGMLRDWAALPSVAIW